MNGKRTVNTGMGDSSRSEAAAAHNGLASAAVKLALVLATLLACLVTLEIGLRFLGRYRGGAPEGYLAQAPVGYCLKSNTTERVYLPTMTFTVYTDDHGFRAKGAGPRPLDRRPYWAVLGSSEVFGKGLDYEQTFIGVMAEKLDRDRIDVVNLAIGGQAFMEQSLRFQRFAAPPTPAPRQVLICLNVGVIANYDDLHEDVVVRQGQLFLRNNWRLPLLKVMLANHSKAYCFFRDGIRKMQLRYSPPKDSDVDFYVKMYSTRHPIRQPVRTADFLRRLKELEDYIRGLNATPVCVYVPTVGGFLLKKLNAEGKLDGSRFDTEFFPELVRTHCREAGIKFVDLEPMLQKKYDHGDKLNFDLDSHFNRPTSRVIGDYLYEALRPDRENPVRSASNQPASP